MKSSHARLLALPGLLLAAMVLTSCAPITVRSMTGRDVDFNTYHSYRWADDGPRATGDPRLDSNPFFAERLTGAAERELAARGYERGTGGTADLVLHYHAGFSQKFDITVVDAAYQQCTNCFAGSLYEAGTIVLDLVDARTNTLVWRSWAETSVDGAIDNQKMMEQVIDEAIRKIVATVPRRL